MAKRKKGLQTPGEVLKQLLEMDCDEQEELERLRTLGVEPSFRNAVFLAVVRKAVKGDVSAIRYLQDLVREEAPERPIEAIDLRALTDDELLALAEHGG